MVYKIITFNLKDRTLHTFEEMPFLTKKERGNGQNPIFIDIDGHEYMKSHLWELTDRKPVNAISIEEKFLPYFADVIEDLPSSYSKSSVALKPKTFKGCQLLSEKHGGYMQFFDHSTGITHRIAMNSNYYEPISQTVTQ